MRVFNEISKSKQFDYLLDKMNTCSILLLVICSTFVVAYLQAEHSYLDHQTYNWLPESISEFLKHANGDQQSLSELHLIDEKKRDENVIVIDAGSTGTRIHLFIFEIEPHRNENQDDTSKMSEHRRDHDNKARKQMKVSLKIEHFKSVKPGLSSYAQQPELAAQSIKGLLEYADEFMDIEVRKNTSINVIATAGLRLLPDEQSKAILNEIEKLLASMKHPYKMNENQVRILDGDSEGIFGWVTINFLLNRLTSPKKSVAVLDLGGGSTQVTFAPVMEETFLQSPENSLIKRNILGIDEYLYTHSYLGFGLMAAREKSIIESMNMAKQYLPNLENINLTHPCFPTGQTVSWSYRNVNYFITGVNGDCYQFVNSLFKKKNTVRQLPELKLREIYAISYYYDLMESLDNIDGNISKVSVYDYYLAARQICGPKFFDTNGKSFSNKRFRQQRRLEKEIKFNVKYPDDFLCLDLTYLANLLNTGLGLQWHKKLNLVRTLNNVETSWALGSALSMLSA